MKVTRIISPLSCHLRFFLICVPETLKLEWQCSQYYELNPTYDNGMFHASDVSNLSKYLFLNLVRPVWEILIFPMQALYMYLKVFSKKTDKTLKLPRKWRF